VAASIAFFWRVLLIGIFQQSSAVAIVTTESLASDKIGNSIVSACINEFKNLTVLVNKLSDFLCARKSGAQLKMIERPARDGRAGDERIVQVRQEAGEATLTRRV
jgi:hypothetical protein